MSTTTHQGYQPFPKLDTPFVDPPSGILALPWYRLLISLWQRLGAGSAVNIQDAVYFSWDGILLSFFSAANNALLGVILTTVVTPGPPVPQVLGASPFVFKALAPGSLVTTSGKIELSRDSGGTYYQVSLQGGACPVQVGDWVRVSWVASAPANCTFFPGI